MVTGNIASLAALPLYMRSPSGVVSDAKLQILGDLIDQMKAQEAATARNLQASTGSINYLEALLKDEYIAAAEPIQIFRDVKTVRTDRTHSRTKQPVREASGRLGISFPVSDFQGAWNVILASMIRAVRKLDALLS